MLKISSTYTIITKTNQVVKLNLSKYVNQYLYLKHPIIPIKDKTNIEYANDSWINSNIWKKIILSKKLFIVFKIIIKPDITSKDKLIVINNLLILVILKSV